MYCGDTVRNSYTISKSGAAETISPYIYGMGSKMLYTERGVIWSLSVGGLAYLWRPASSDHATTYSQRT